MREAKLLAVDYILLLVAGALLGILTKGNDESFGSNGYTYTVISVCKSETLLLNLIISAMILEMKGTIFILGYKSLDRLSLNETFVLIT